MSKMRLSYEDLKDKVGGRLELSVLLQKRIRELMDGAPPLVQIEGDMFDIALHEVKEGKIYLDKASPEELEDMRMKERLQMAKLIKARKRYG
ncbi:MAG: DNA-directed RNA polymerase subunit omega [Planctomycetota bacterium]